MAAPNAQPFGARGGMAAPQEHPAPGVSTDVPKGFENSTTSHGVADGDPEEGTPTPVGANKKNILH